MGYIPKELGQYVYLASLEILDNDFASRARNYVTFNNPEFTDKDHNFEITINNAIQQLKKIADSEAAKEQKAIQTYIEKLKKYKDLDTTPEPLRKKLNDQINKIISQNFSKVQNDQVLLIQQINVLRQDLNIYKRRLNEINAINIADGKKIYANNRTEFNMLKSLEAYFQNQSKRSTSNTIRINRDQLLHKRLKEIIQQELPDFPSEFFSALEAAFFVDFNYWAENNLNPYLEINISDLDEILDKYFSTIGKAGEETHFLKMINKKNEGLKSIASDIKKQMHIEYISDVQLKELQELQIEANKEQNKNKKSFLTSTGKSYTKNQINNLLKNYQTKIINNTGEHLSFISHSRTGHGNFYEIINTILQAAINVKSNVAADLIVPIGSITFNSNEENIHNELLNLSNDISDIISDSFDAQEVATIENFNKQVEYQKNMSKQIAQKITETEKALQKIQSDCDNFFITHESLKLYRGAEEGSETFEEFHGRKMNIMNALTKLYAAPGLADNMIDSKMLITYLLNIDEQTVTHGENKHPLETYLSLFAGLLMFDDIAEISSTAINNIVLPQNSTFINQLHLYNINGIYFPLSMILNNLISQITEVTMNLSLDASHTAIAKIEQTLPSIPSESTSNNWNSFAQETISNTKIQIAFLSGFTAYIQKLFNAFNVN